MFTPPDETEALRRTLLVAFAAFLTGFIGTAAFGIWFIIHVSYPQDGWWALVYVPMWAFALPLITGAGTSILTGFILDRWYHFRGAYRCFQCGSALPIKGWCACRAHEWREFQRRYPEPRPRKPWRHYRRRLLPALLAHLVLVLPAVALAMLVPYARSNSFGSVVLVWHLILCWAVWFVGRFLPDILRSFSVGKRFRIRYRVFSRFFFFWPHFVLFCLIR